METVNEESTGWLTVTFKDKDGDNQAPASAEYRIDTSHGEEVRGWSSISSPSAEHEITLTPDDNKIQGTLDTQQNIVTVHAEFGSDDERNDTYTYEIEALDQIPKSS